MIDEVRTPKLLGEADLPWIAQLVDLVERSVGKPWRTLADRVEHAQLGVHASERNAVLHALRRVLGGGAARSRIARDVRTLALGPPVIDPIARTARLTAAGAELGIEPDEVESLLWIDLAMERPVTLPDGRPSELELAAFANLDRLQSTMRRAHEIELRVWDEANDLVRQIARSGLLAQVRRDGDATVLEVMGPLQLFHATTVYGRTLARLVPWLAEHDRFELAMRCQLRDHVVMFRIAPPLLLPRIVADRPRAGLAERLARDLADRGYPTEREPSPIASGDSLLFPELALQHASGIWYLEILNFTTEAFIAARFAAYASAGTTNVILCVDGRRSQTVPNDPRVHVYADATERGKARPIDPEAILAIIERRPPPTAATDAKPRATRGISRRSSRSRDASTRRPSRAP
jgi:predicted nuclease of restriction endonuclease-like RecB superfamily